MAGEAVLKELKKTENDRLKPRVITSQLIKNISDHHAQLINKVRHGNMVLRGDTLYVLEVEPAGYAYYAANEAEKTSRINISRCWALARSVGSIFRRRSRGHRGSQGRRVSAGEPRRARTRR